MVAEVLLTQIKTYLQAANDESVGMSEDIIEKAGEEFKEILRSTFNQKRGKFRLRMSAVGRPACQLMMERDEARKEPKTASFRMKMLIGDATETILRAVMRAAGIDIQGTNEKVSLDIGNDIRINGSYDFKIADKIWDAKTSSNWAFTNKWMKGFSHIEEHDNFGYCAQLYGYAEAENQNHHKEITVGGWFVCNKETGDITVVEAIDTPEHRKIHLDRLKKNVFKVLNPDQPFEREFEDEEETFYKKPTGNRKLGIACGFCEFKYSCWPGLQAKLQAKSKSKSPKLVYYTEYNEQEEEEENDT